MNWGDEREKIRRFLRDPDAAIWSDELLLRIYNDEQRYLHHRLGLLEKIDILRVPPMFGCSHTFDWEWAHCFGGKAYQWAKTYYQSPLSCTHRWEAQAIGGIDASDTTEGDVFTYPWEAWLVSNAADLVPIWFPSDYHKTIMMAWDKEPIGFASIKAIMNQDRGWVTRQGEPICYTRSDESENVFYLYPRPSTVTWDDIDSIYYHIPGTYSDYADLDGAAQFQSDDSDDADVGIYATRESAYFNQDVGAALDVLNPDNNVFIVYDALPADVTDSAEGSSYPTWMRKYFHYGIISDAYGSNTDGKISSLAEYWAWRKELGFKHLMKFKAMRRADRDYCMTTKGSPIQRSRRHPRLPSGYPVVNP